MCVFRLLIIILMLASPTLQVFESSEPAAGPEYFASLIIPLIFNCIIRCIVIRYNIPIPIAVFVVIMSVLWGVCILYTDVLDMYSGIVEMDPGTLLEIFLPVMVYRMAVCLDIHAFKRSLSQILIISIPANILCTVTVGLIMRSIIDETWSYSLTMIYGALVASIYPNEVITLLQNSFVNTKHVIVLLEGECIFGVWTSYLIIDLATAYHAGYISQWYHFVVQIIRFTIFGFCTILGVMLGWICCFLIKRTVNNIYTMTIIFICIPFVTYYFVDVTFPESSLTATAIVGLMVSSQKAAMSSETARLFGDTLKVMVWLLNTILYTYTTLFVVTHIIPNMNHFDNFFIVCAYFVGYACRFLSILFFTPILSRIGYGFTLKNLLICFWGGINAPYTVLTPIIMEQHWSHLENECHLISLHTWYLYVMSVLINGTTMRMTLRMMGISEVSQARRINMNNSMKYLLTKKEKAITVLKMDRFYLEVNWPIVREMCNMKHPYKMKINTAEEDQDFMGYRFSYCTDCLKEVIGEPTPRELREMRREAKIRILKAKKISYARQYANGMISSDGVRTLNQAVEMALDSEEALIQLDGLFKQFTQRGCFAKFIRRRIQKLQENLQSRPPRTYWRRLCYRIIMHNYFNIFIFVAIILYCAFGLAHLYYHIRFEIHGNYNYAEIFLAISTVLYLIFLIEFIIMIMAYSRVYICQHGFATYFKSTWNWIDFIILCISTFMLIVDYIDLFISHFHMAYWNLLRLVYFLRIIRLIRILYPQIIKSLDKKIDSNLIFYYEIGQGYAYGEKEILEKLLHMIDHEKIRDEMKQRIQEDIVVITKFLGLVQKDKPWVAISVKTKQAIRTILNSINEAMSQLKSLGWIDDYEQYKLKQSMIILYKNAGNIKFVHPSPPKVIFKEVSWMAAEKEVIDFLFENVTVRKFEPGDIVFTEGMVAAGIYIVVTGLLELSYKPNPYILKSLQYYGTLPIVDYISYHQYDEDVVDYIVSGNCVGELSTLTDRAYNCTITANTHTQVYALSNGILKRAMEINPDPISGLQCRIWKEVSIRIAIPILVSTPAYQSFSLDQIKYALERAFVPNLKNYKIFVVTDMIEDIILIEGVVADYNTRTTFTAPDYIPRNVQKLILPTSSLLKIPINIQTKLLIIPDKTVDEYDVMIKANEICELVMTSDTSVKCLQHLIQERIMKQRKKKMERGVSLHQAQYRSESSDEPSGTAARRASILSESDVFLYKNEITDKSSFYIDVDTNKSSGLHKK